MIIISVFYCQYIIIMSVLHHHYVDIFLILHHHAYVRLFYPRATAVKGASYPHEGWLTSRAQLPCPFPRPNHSGFREQIMFNGLVNIAFGIIICWKYVNFQTFHIISVCLMGVSPCFLQEKVFPSTPITGGFGTLHGNVTLPLPPKKWSLPFSKQASCYFHRKFVFHLLKKKNLHPDY